MASLKENQVITSPGRLMNAYYQKRLKETIKTNQKEKIPVFCLSLVSLLSLFGLSLIGSNTESLKTS
jgi:hypothetical protein